jgi:hypothetical protein
MLDQITGPRNDAAQSLYLRGLLANDFTAADIVLFQRVRFHAAPRQLCVFGVNNHALL